MDRTAYSWLCAVVLAVAWLGAVGEARASDEQHRSKTLYQSYCAACHGDLGAEVGAYRGSRRPPAPDLRQLESVHGAPLPRAALMHFVLDPRRTGAARVCSQRPFAWAAPGPATWSMRRGMVLNVLRHLETIQRPTQPSIGPGASDG